MSATLLVLESSLELSAYKRMQTIRGLWPPGPSVSGLDPLPLDVRPDSWLLEGDDKRSHHKNDVTGEEVHPANVRVRC